MNIDMIHLAKLCKIKIDNGLSEKIKTDISKILKSVNDLPNFDKNESFFNPNNIMSLRDDSVTEQEFTRDDILKNAPKIKAGCVVVPKEID